MAKNIYLFGKQGSGKDTIADYLVQNHNYHKIRIAGTIKSVICDILNVDFESLEELKRKYPMFRKLHHRIAEDLNVLADKYGNKTEFQTSMYRLQQILNHNSIDFENINKNQNFVVSDVRGYTEVFEILKHLKETKSNDKLVMLLRLNEKQYTDNTHWTNGFDFNDDIVQELTHYKDNLILIDNNEKHLSYYDELYKQFGDLIYNIREFYMHITGEILIKEFKNIINL